MNEIQAQKKKLLVTLDRAGLQSPKGLTVPKALVHDM